MGHTQHLSVEVDNKYTLHTSVYNGNIYIYTLSFNDLKFFTLHTCLWTDEVSIDYFCVLSGKLSEVRFFL